MALFVLTCIDHENALDRRMAARPAHLDYVGKHRAMVKIAGPLLDEADGMAGSMFILEAPSRADVEAFSAADPYRLADVFRSIEIRPFRVTVGQLPWNPARPAAGTRLCGLDEIEDPGARGFVFREGDALFLGLVVRVGDEAFGYVDRCPHAGSPLGNVAGRFLTREGDLILCAAHGALFRRGDGRCMSGPCAGQSLTAWPVRIDDGVVIAA